MNNQIFETLMKQSYFVGNFQVITLPIKRRGYSVNEGRDKLIFVSSKLSRAERAEVVNWLIKKRDKLKPTE
jgi:hypothetical protein